MYICPERGVLGRSGTTENENGNEIMQESITKDYEYNEKKKVNELA